MNVEVVFWDVQHGQSSYIKSPNNRHIVIDLGTGSYGGNNEEFSPLMYLKNRFGVQQLDYVVITHPHKDHIDDIFNFDALSPKVFRRPRHLTKEEIMKDVREQDIPKFEKYFEIDRRYDYPVSEDNDPSNPDNYGGLIIRGFGPRSCSTSNINNHSIVKVISYAGIRVVFTGDNESCSFNELLEDTEFRTSVRDADILLAPHHGRESGHHNDFVSLVNPRLTVISDGRFCDSSATSRYSEKSRGWRVHKRGGGSEVRYCVTTRNDGVIVASFGINNDGNNFLQVTIN
ncbi:MAG TPA: MBL fold metallo-hydrolase [Candidatus Atribacteria bacterium]|nr:MAG: MBL fold metallo-hydrolase [Candidatus Bathyarchaeota archaeon]HEC91826.1 MBL fold metallo-hydrolase [Candidatus Atribacteria bacterium]